MANPILASISRRRVLLLGGAFALAQLPLPLAAATGREMIVYKSSTCGCCTAWADIMKGAGFTVTIKPTDDLDTVRQQAGGVPTEIQGCHVAFVDGYIVEGHVPVAAVEKLLAERPAIRGITVAGMPDGSPGMGDNPAARFDVMAFNHPSGSDAFVYYKAGT